MVGLISSIAGLVRGMGRSIYSTTQCDVDMKKFSFCSVLLFLLLLATVLPKSLFAEMQISGAIFANTTWSVEGSPYKIIGNVQIAPGVMLTIVPGVTVHF